MPFRLEAAVFRFATKGSLVNPRSRPIIAGLGEQLEWPPLIITVVFSTSKIHIVLHWRVRSGNAFTCGCDALSFSGRGGSFHVVPRGREKTLRGAKGDHFEPMRHHVAILFRFILMPTVFGTSGVMS